MPGTRYAYLDLTVLPALRRRVLASEAAILFTADMRHVLWANSAGAILFGGAGIAELLENPLNPAQPFVRQLHDAAIQIEDGEPMARGFRVARGLRTQFIRCELSRLRLTGGEAAVLLTCIEDRPAKPMRERDLAEAAVEALADFATAAAIIDDYGLTIAATESFADIDLSPEDLGGLVREAADDPDQLVKRLKESPGGKIYAVGVARIRDRPGRFLLVCAEAGAPEPEIEESREGEAPVAPTRGEAREPTSPPEWEDRETGERTREAGSPPLGAEIGEEPRIAPARPDGADASDKRTETVATPPRAEATRRQPSLLDRWYFGLMDEADQRSEETRPAGAVSAPRTEPNLEGEAARKTEEPGAPTRAEPREAEAAIAPAAERAEPDAEHATVGHGQAQPAFEFPRNGEAVRFAWIIDGDQIFRSVSPELAKTVGPHAADIVGRAWADVATVFGFDQSGEIRRLLEKRDTWSGKSVLWPVQGTDLVVPIDLAALPAFNAARQFDGFRGFGIIRTADAVIDPDETGLALVPGRRGEGPEQTDLFSAEARAGKKAAEEGSVEARRLAAARPDEENAEAGRGRAANVVDLASRKRAENGDELSRHESQAFSEIGRTLRGSAVEGEPELEDRPWRPRLEPPAEQSPKTVMREEPETGEAGLSRQAPATTSILAQLPVPVLVYRDGETLFANRELLELTGYESIEALDAAGGVAALLAGENDGDARATLTLKDGRRTEISPLLQSVPWEGGKALLLSFRQATGQQPAGAQTPSEEKIALDMARVAELQNILDTATDGIIITNGEGRIESLNASAEALFGIDHGDVAQRPLTELFAQESHKTISDYMAELAEPGVASILNDGREVIGKEANGGLIPLFITIGRIGAAEKSCVVIRDMTQWKKAEEELVNARRAAELASEQKSNFLARVSHEIRTPLNAIIGFSDVMLEERFGPVGNERYREYLRDINRSGVHVLDLINDLLDISKIEAGKMELTYEAVDLNQLVAETVALLQPQANRERIIIRTSLSRAVPRVVADARSIRQIILNLVSNAIKFTSENGQVIVSTVYEGNGEVALRVRDTGCGMSEQEIENAMKPFHQLRSGNSRRGEGTGLGLPLTKALVEANRAYFDLESTPGDGTIAHVHFPTQRVLAD